MRLWGGNVKRSELAESRGTERSLPVSRDEFTLDLLAEAFKVDDKNFAGVQDLALSIIDPQLARYNLIDLVSLTLSPGFEDVKRIEENLMASYPTAFTVGSPIASICSKNKPLNNA